MQIAFNIPEDILHHLLDPVPIPDWVGVRYTQPTPPALQDVGLRTREAMRQAGAEGMLSPGERVAPGSGRVAVAVGSRGIARLPEIVRAVVAEIRDAGGKPFIVPAMGSHGGATASGQREVLEHLGITDDTVGAPVESQMGTVVVGHTPDGTPVQVDRMAAEADAIVLVVRIKPHTAFRGAYESGLAKMIAIGLGKQAGAATTHARGFGEMAQMVPEMARVALGAAPIKLGVAVLENAHDLPFKIVGVPGDRILADEPGLLEQARAAMPRLPFQQLDVLVIDRIGKNISGDGADPNITGRYPTPFASGGPTVNKQVVLDLTDASTGNANGVGTSDFTTVRLTGKMDLGATYPNALTSTVAGPVKLPMVLPSDRLALQAALLTCNAVGREPRLLRIKDTLRLDELWLSAALLAEARDIPAIEIMGEPVPPAFDLDGNLPDLSEPPLASQFQAVGVPVAPAGHPDAW